jgi:hypothetical protein
MIDAVEQIEIMLSDVAADASLADLSAALVRLRTRFPAPDLIDFLTSSAPGIASIGASSYAHANGFDKFLLGETATCKLRLHIWWNGIDGIESDLHNHNWDFASNILCGSLRTELFDISDSPGAGSYLHYRFTPAKDGSMQYDMACLGRQALRKTFDTDHGAGSIYAIDHRQIHRGDPAASQPTATMILQSQTRTDSTSVFRVNLEDSFQGEVICEPFGAAKTLRKFADLKVLLDRQAQPADQAPTRMLPSRSRIVSNG